MASELRIITGCAAVHPDQRGGQHVAMACPGVLVIDDDRQLGVLMFSERSQFKNIVHAKGLLMTLTSAADRDALAKARDALIMNDALDEEPWRDTAVDALDKLLARGGER